MAVGAAEEVEEVVEEVDLHSAACLQEVSPS
jgi:hypothetical protein